nr:hypothetical protein [Planctomycetota bacterium]
SFDTVIAAKVGSALAKALVTPPAALTAGAVAAAARLTPQPGMMDATVAYDITAAGTYFADLLGRLQTQPGGKEMITPEMITAFSSSLGAWSGAGAFHFGMSDTAKLQIEGAYGTPDAAKARAVMQKLLASMYGETGALAAMNKANGITLKVTQDVRKSGATPVDKVEMVIDETKVPPAQLAQIKAMAMGYELAYAQPMSFMASDPKVLDALLAGKQGGMTVAATRTIGPGRNVYLDLNLSAFAHLAGAMGGPMPQPVKDALAKLKPSAPIAAAASVGDGRTRQEWRIPVTSILDIVTAVKAANGKGPAPAPANDPGF